MVLDLRLLNWDILKSFLHRGMTHVWTKGVPEEYDPLLPGVKVVRHHEVGLLLADVFIESPRGGNGITIFYKNNMPIWRLWWHGFWDEDPQILECLRAAILDAHSRSEFLGGRGTHGFKFEGLTYNNYLTDILPREWWKPHSGEEMIYRDDIRPRLRIEYGTGPFRF